MAAASFTQLPSASTTFPSYANALKKPTSTRKPETQVTLIKGKPFSIKRQQLIIIGPTDEAKDKFLDADATITATQNTIDLTELNIGVRRVNSNIRAEE